MLLFYMIIKGYWNLKVVVAVIAVVVAVVDESQIMPD